MRTLITVTVVLALSAVAHAGRGGSEATIRSAVRSGNADAIIAALEQAENIPCSSTCMTMVMELTENDDYRIREVAAWWFARRPAQKRELAERSLAELVTGDSTAARNAADILGTFGAAASIEPLATAYARDGLEEPARVAIVRALGRIGNTAGNPTLAAAFGDPSAAVRLEAIEAWRHMRRQDGAAPVAALVADADVSVRRAAAATVGFFRQADARAALETALTSDPDPAARRNAAWALGRIGDEASRDALTAAAADPSGLVRMTAKAALRQLR